MWDGQAGYMPWMPPKGREARRVGGGGWKRVRERHIFYAVTLVGKNNK